VVAAFGNDTLAHGVIGRAAYMTVHARATRVASRGAGLTARGRIDASGAWAYTVPVKRRRPAGRHSGMRDYLILWINGVRRQVRGEDAFLTLSDFLRGRLGLVGTKIVCSEGDCGACTVLVATPTGRRHLPIDSCIRFVFQLDGCHVVTVEALARDGALAPVQQAMIDCHGSQCGFCTPGFVMTMAGACESGPAGACDWREELSGNLCRCTGYLPILEAGAQAAAVPGWLAARFPSAEWAAEAAALARDSLEISAGDRRVFCPTTLAEAVALRRAHPTARVVAGATDLGVLWNKGRLRADEWLDLNRVAELGGIAVDREGPSGRIVAGALATWTDCIGVCDEHCPEFSAILRTFGGPQIRHVGTFGGNIVNGSPIADSLPLLFAMDAEVELRSAAGTRRVGIGPFFKGYRQVDLRPDELLTRVLVPLPGPHELLSLSKVSRRKDLDISTFTAAIRISLDGDRIAAAAIAYGGVGPTVLRLPRTEAFLAGRPFTEESFRRAGELAVGEIAPLSDVRGTADYRLQLARNVLLKFFHEGAQVAA
jgi:xanthine dehydrogenase small subunit